MNETRCRVLEEQMPRMRSTAKATRYLCVAIAVILHNLVIIANMELLALSRNAAGTVLPTHDTVVAQFIRALKSLFAKWRREPDPILDADAPPYRQRREHPPASNPYRGNRASPPIHHAYPPWPDAAPDSRLGPQSGQFRILRPPVASSRCNLLQN